ncbi:type VI immunity family protein [Sorangium sp. So ce1182]|uniref:type VI immunity family protein n=1 Tax=Sorangium sp. So ce1182 TaxID=3133334 RepID=UPI003F605C26
MTTDTQGIDALLAAASDVVAPALAITIYFQAPIDDYKDGVIYCLDSFLARWEQNITFYADEDIGRFRKATPKLLRYPIERLRNRNREMSLFAWTMGAGKKLNSASALSFESYVREHDPVKLSYVRASFPVDAYRGPEGAERFVELARDWAKRLPFVHGYGGLALNQSPESGAQQQNSAIVFALASRFPGFEVEDCGGTVLVGQESIKGVNWLTLLGDKFVARVGGAESLRRGLSDAIELHSIQGRGLLIRAGKEPGTGDVNRGARLPLYGEVSRALAPIRMLQHPDLGPAEFGSFGPQGTAAWLRRFD